MITPELMVWLLLEILNCTGWVLGVVSWVTVIWVSTPVNTKSPELTLSWFAASGAVSPSIKIIIIKIEGLVSCHW